MIVGMNHFTVIAEDEQKTLAFYVGLLGLSVGHRPRPRLCGCLAVRRRPAGGAARVLRPGRRRRSAPA
jgi:catechol 2,3-dioxygenase-like lactoylglutathione lyase family enzyme